MPSARRILIVDDEPSIRLSVAAIEALLKHPAFPDPRR